MSRLERQILAHVGIKYARIGSIDSLRIKSPAKVNLGLEVLRRREDGFHDLCSIMLAIDLCDEVEVLAGEGVSNSENLAGNFAAPA